MNRQFLFPFLAFLIFISCPGWAEEKAGPNPVCAVYITGIGCGNCAVTDPVLFVNAAAAYPDLIVFEYEIYHLRRENQKTQESYFQHYVPEEHAGVPFFVLNAQTKAIGRTHVLRLIDKLGSIKSNAFPALDGTAVDFNDLDLTRLPGAVKIWTKNRVLIHGRRGDSVLLKKVLLVDDITQALEGAAYQDVDPEPVAISGGEINFEYAVKIGDWRLQWNGAPVAAAQKTAGSSEPAMAFMLVSLFVLVAAFSFFKVSLRKTSKGAPLKFEFRGRIRDLIIVSVSLAALIVFFMSAKHVSPDALETMGYDMPLPVFTFLIALVDGFNPCNMFVLTCLLTLMISTSDSKRRLYLVGASFVGMVYVFYFFFMALWLNVFQWISFVTPLRIGIGLIAVAAGVINCKELFFFKKGISLTIPDQQKGLLMKRMQEMREVVQKGSLSVLVVSSLGLAALASLVELPCTAGFPIIYTGILAGRGLQQTAGYYVYLGYYNLVYVLPLCVIIFVFIHTFKSRQITQRQMEVIKFIGGVIMLILGILLLVNPGILGLQI